MKRVVVLGGSGFFGGLIVERLRAAGLEPLAASRSSGELRIDANNPDDVRMNLKQRDLVIDAAGPFQKRNSALIEAARSIGFDIIDLSDSADYTAMIYQHEPPIRAAGIRVLTACSALSSVSAVALKLSGIERPVKISVYLQPASRFTASAGTVGSFLNSIEGRIRGFRFPQPIGERSGMTVKSVDAVTLPPVFQNLKTEFVVDAEFSELLRFKFVRGLLERFQSKALKLAHRIGETRGVLGFEVTATLRHKQLIFAGEKSYLLAVLPAVFAATAIAEGRFAPRGLVAPTDHVDPEMLMQASRAEGIEIIHG